MEEIQTRLKDSTESCLKAYDQWYKQKNVANRENLQEAIHELRKVASRLEIDIAMSEREGGSNRPIPIPEHRSNMKAKGNFDAVLGEEDSDDEPQGEMSAPKEGGGRPRHRHNPRK